MDKYIYFLIKIFDEDKHAEMFLDGFLHSKKLSYFRKLYDEALGNRGDKHEGVISWYKAEELIIEINGVTLKDVVGNVSMNMNYHDNVNIFCLYASYQTENFELTQENLPKLIEELKISESCLGLGRKAVIVTNVEEFINRVFNKAEQQQLNFKAGLIEYYDPEIFSGKFKDDDAIFKKRIEFSHQKEYRFAFYPNNISDDAMNLDIGNIRDIAFKMEAREINNEIKISKITR
ncbi:hypothetical protein V6257_09300 [Pseudoalteromonas issachenkonii]|uniref:Uncharacterized protein n=1 Tax=Pseudoalteromonas issachenkonii TaxID=152297 RepID=A0ABU9H0E7_9GAMM